MQECAAAHSAKAVLAELESPAGLLSSPLPFPLPPSTF